MKETKMTQPNKLNNEWEERFDTMFPEYKGIGYQFPIFAENPNKEHIKQFIRAHKEKWEEAARKEGYNQRMKEEIKVIDREVAKAFFMEGSEFEDVVKKRDEKVRKEEAKEERNEILAIIEKVMGEWSEPQPGAGKELGPLAGTGMYMQYDADRKKRRQEIQELRSLIHSRQKDELTL